MLRSTLLVDYIKLQAGGRDLDAAGIDGTELRVLLAPHEEILAGVEDGASGLPAA